MCELILLICLLPIQCVIDIYYYIRRGGKSCKKVCNQLIEITLDFVQNITKEELGTYDIFHAEVSGISNSGFRGEVIIQFDKPLSGEIVEKLRLYMSQHSLRSSNSCRAEFVASSWLPEVQIGKYRVSKVEVKILDRHLRIDFTCDTCNGHTSLYLSCSFNRGISELDHLAIEKMKAAFRDMFSECEPK